MVVLTIGRAERKELFMPDFNNIADLARKLVRYTVEPDIGHQFVDRDTIHVSLDRFQSLRVCG